MTPRQGETRAEYLERDRARSAAYYAAHRAEVLARQCAHAKAIRAARGPLPRPRMDPAEVRRRKAERLRRWKQDHADHVRAYYRAWAAAHPERLRAMREVRARARVTRRPRRLANPKYLANARDQRLRYWVGDGVRDPAMRAVAESLIALRDELAASGLTRGRPARL